MNFLLDSATRLDWGLGNPNKTAILIVEFLIIVLAGILRVPIRHPWRAWRCGGWLLLVFSSAMLLWCLLLTQSRGGLVALVGGGVVLLWYAPRPWPWLRIAAVLLVLCLVIGAARGLGVTTRLATVTPQADDSIVHRLEIWRAAPRMMLDAPSGWGLGQAGAAYTQWYQPLERTEIYRSLVNSHLTWLVELGWPGRCGYVLAWATIFVLCGSGALMNFSGRVTMALWVTLFVGMIFSSVGESPPLWTLPGGGLAVVLLMRLRWRTWPTHRAWIAGGVCALLVLMACSWVGWLTPQDIRIRGGKSSVQLASNMKGPPSATVWLVPDVDICGGHSGHAVRAEVARGQGFHVVQAVEQINARAMSTNVILVLAGTMPTHWPTGFRSITLFNPRGLPPPEKPATPLRIVWGELREQGDKTAWRNWAQSLPQGQFVEVPAAAEFIPDWAQWLMF